MCRLNAASFTSTTGAGNTTLVAIASAGGASDTGAIVEAPSVRTTSHDPTTAKGSTHKRRALSITDI